MKVRGDDVAVRVALRRLRRVSLHVLKDAIFDQSIYGDPSVVAVFLNASCFFVVDPGPNEFHRYVGFYAICLNLSCGLPRKLGIQDLRDLP